MAGHILLGDLSNGSYVKLALARPGERPTETVNCACNSLAEFKTAIQDFLAAQNNPDLVGAAISAAGWEKSGIIKLPNHGFSLDRGDLRAFLGIQRLNLVNDFVAKAMAVPRLEPHEYEKICGGEPLPEQVIAVIGPHVGLGVSALAPDSMGSWTVMPTEGGHSDLAPTTETEEAVLRILADKYGHVSRERVISIPGLSDVWRALARIDGEDASAPDARSIIAAAAVGDARAKQTIDLSMGWFAAMASDIALILGARGGVYLAGELLDMIGDLFDPDAFIARYSAKGRLTDYVAEVPVFKVTAHDMEVIGLATLYD